MITNTPRVGALLAFAMLSSVAAAPAAEPTTPSQAIERAVADRLGPLVSSVEVTAVSTRVEPQPRLVAVPDPSAYIGRTVRFTLTADGRRRGIAVARVRVRARVAKALRPIERDRPIEADAVSLVEDDVTGVRFVRLPQPGDIVGARAKRDIATGLTITTGMFALPADVRNGDRIAVGVTIGPVHVTGEGIASGSGYVGDLVRVIQPGRRGSLTARIIERGVVEVVP